MPQTQLRNFNVASGQSIDIGVGWLVKGVAIENNTSVWYILQPQGYLIPPSTLGWTRDLPQGSSALNLSPTVYSGQPNYLFSGDVLQVTVFSDPIGTSGGYSAIPNDERASTFSASPGATITTGTLSYPAIGLRVDNNTGTWYQIGATGILVPPFTTGFTIDLIPPITALTVSPATPPYGPANANTGTGIVVTLYATKIGNYGGTTAALSIGGITLVQSTFATAPNADTVTATFSAGAGAGHLLVASATHSGSLAEAWSVTPMSNNIVTGGAIQYNYALRYQIASGGETSFTATANGGAANPVTVLAIAEYSGFPNGVYVTGSAIGANSASATPAAYPNKLICLSSAGQAAAIGSPSSSNTVLRQNPSANQGAQFAGAAIGDLTYQSVGSETGTIVWASATALATAVIIGI